MIAQDSGEILLQILKDFGFPVTALIIVIWTGAKGHWVFGREFTNLQKKCEKYEELAMRSTNAAEQATKLSHSVAEMRVEDIERAKHIIEEAQRRGQL